MGVQGCESGFISSVAIVLQPVVFPPGDFVVLAGETGQEMYLINRGNVEILAATGNVKLRELSHGDFGLQHALVFL